MLTKMKKELYLLQKYGNDILRSTITPKNVKDVNTCLNLNK